MVQTFSTDDIHQRNRFEYWSDAVCESYVQLGCDTDRRDYFSGTIKLNRMSRIATSVVAGSQQIVRRRKKDIGVAGEAYFLISLQTIGNCLVEQDGQSAMINPGDFALYSSVDPYTLSLPDGFEQLVIQVPREQLLKRLPNADLLTGRAVCAQHQMGSFVGKSLLELAKTCEREEGIVSDCLQHTITDLLAAGFASLENSDLSLKSPEQQLLLRAQQVIRQNYADPNLDRTRLASVLGLSLRRLSEIYRLNGTSVSASIREYRLDMIESQLKDPRYNRYTISEIALGCGINNLQHFSKQFKLKFGSSPRDYRESYYRKYLH